MHVHAISRENTLRHKEYNRYDLRIKDIVDLLIIRTPEFVTKIKIFSEEINIVQYL